MNYGSFRAAIYEAVTRGCGFASVTTNHFVYCVWRCMCVWRGMCRVWRGACGDVCVERDGGV